MTLKQICEKLGCDYISLSYCSGSEKKYSASLHYGDKVFMALGRSAVEAIKFAYRQAKDAGFDKKPALRIVK